MAQRFLGILFLVGIFIFFNRDFASDFKKAFQKKPKAAVQKTEETINSPQDFSKIHLGKTESFKEFLHWAPYSFKGDAEKKFEGHFFDAKNKVEIFLEPNNETELLSAESCIFTEQTEALFNEQNQIQFLEHLGQTALLVKPHWLFTFLPTAVENKKALRGEYYKFENGKWVLGARFLAVQDPKSAKLKAPCKN